MIRFFVAVGLFFVCCVGYAKNCQPKLSPEQAYLQLKGDNSPKTSVSVTNKKININTATEAELVQLHGIGASKAKAIILYREMMSPFGSVDDLARVKGIGQGIVDKNRDLITVLP